LRVFAVMTGIEARLAGAPHGGAARLRGAPSDADVLALAAEVRALRGKLGLAPATPVAPVAAHDTFERPL
jgi:hypothetical protein